MTTLQQTQKLAQHLSPQQILQSSILQLNSLMLEERILAELEQNPALEMLEQELPPSSDDESETEANEEEIDWEELLNSPEDYNVSRFEDHSREKVEIQLAASDVADASDHPGLHRRQYGEVRERNGNGANGSSERGGASHDGSGGSCLY